MTHQIRSSSRRAFRSCRRRWDWNFRQGYVPLEEPKPLEFGRAFHCAMESIYDPDTWFSTSTEEKLALAKKVFTLECEKQRDEFLKQVGQMRLNFDQTDDYDSRTELGCGMLEHYVREVHAKQDDWFKPVKVEIEFEVPLADENGNSIHCTQSPQCGQIHENIGEGSIVTYASRVDALIEDLVHGGYYIVDWKTAAQLIARAEFLQLDDQVGSYPWALRLLLGIDVRGFIYAEIRKAYPVPPHELKRRRNGCWFSQDKSQPFELNMYRETIKEYDKEAWELGLYDEFLAFLAGPEAPKFHQRFVIVKTDDELKNIGINIAYEAADMVDSALRIYPSVGRFSCPTCAYVSPCMMKFKSENYQYTLDTMYQKREADG